MTWILLLLLALLVFAMVVIYNSLVRMRELVDASWSDIDVKLKQRHDLVPNLVETVKGYATHERETLEKVIQARSAAMSATTPHDRAQAESALTRSLGSIFALSESYPDLKANQNFLQLQGTLGNLETKIEQARRHYNAMVRDFNTRVRQVPANIVASAFGFPPREFFEVDEGERTVPKVSF
jgi:LemA protein